MNNRDVISITMKPSGEDEYLGLTNRTLAIFLVSVLGLFLEMLFIRWISTEVRIFAYLQNTILVVCFLGLGLGCFTSRQPVDLQKMLLPLFFLVMLFAIPFTKIGFGLTSEMLKKLKQTVANDMWSIFYASSKKKYIEFFTQFKKRWEKDMPFYKKIIDKEFTENN
jgi:hypothetical protein